MSFDATLSRTRRRGRCAAALFVAAALFASAHAQAAQFELLAGPSWTSGQRSTKAVFFEALGETRTWHALRWQPDVGLGWIEARGTPRERLDHDVGVAAAGVRLPDLWHGLFVGFQLAAATPHTGALCSAQQFVSSLGWRRGRAVVMLRHISNGSTREPNLGETMLLAGVDF
ncbi:Lipid A 3-O-deacylase [Mizugakiibacter sediminis]|uniref:Lipid A 3-O-deacylase n=1 Tax=Mizugakiibacter sediminis TaxID=1475481 RepID=A0A0K8QLF3_9GAMM|nr:hypothetical protein [Mizugakiibacter sediminis]GAP65551.1 Lipid A 3-O-deacylase [Mizugakiibacter sediminis]